MAYIPLVLVALALVTQPLIALPTLLFVHWVLYLVDTGRAIFDLPPAAREYSPLSHLLRLCNRHINWKRIKGDKP